MQIKPSGQYHHGQLAESLVQAGMQSVAEHGSDALSLRKLAQSIGVSATAAYKHFSSKADLADAIRHGIKDQFDQSIALAFEMHTDPGLRMFEMGKAYLNFARKHPLWFDFLFSGPLSNTSLKDDPSESLFFKATSEMSGNSMAEEDLFVASMQGWALIHGLATLERQNLIGTVCPELDDNVLAAIFERTANGWR